MGTSKSNLGPKKNTKMLPDWAEDSSNAPDSNDNGNLDDNPEGQEDSKPEEKPDILNDLVSGSWRAPRRALGKYTLNPTETNFKGAVKSYAKAAGGAKGLSKSARGGKIVAGNLVSFLGGVRQNGFENTYEEFTEKKYKGSSVNEVFSNLADSLSTPGGTDDDAIARNAVVDALKEIYNDFDLESKSFDELNSLDEENIGKYLECYIASYINQRWLHELGVKMEEKEIKPSDLVKAEKAALGFIRASVKLDFDNLDLSKFDPSSPVGIDKMDKIFEEAYTIIETL